MNNSNVGYRNQKVLEELYQKEGLSLRQIAKRFNTSSTVILEWMQKLNLPRRPSNKNKAILTREQLEELYWKKKLSVNKIGKLFNKSGSLILHYMKKYNIKRRPPAERKIQVTKELLEKLYWDEKLSLNQIGKKLCVSGGLILYYMKKFGIPREKRKPVQLPKVKFTKEMLENLYWKQKLNQKEIAEKFGVSSTVVSKYMRRFGVPRRTFIPTPPSKKINVPKEALEELYIKKKLPSNKIAEIFNVDHSTILRRLEEYDIKKRLPAAVLKYPKTSFSDNSIEKAYMIGLRIGDVYAKTYNRVVRVQSTTTHPAFIEMMKTVFDKYSHVGVHKFFNKDFNSWQWFVYSDLNKSFDFLLEKPKEIPEWIMGEENLFYSFLAGYADAEGCWRILKSHEKFVRFVFKIDSMDELILKQIKATLEKFGIKVNFYLKQKKGTIRNNNGKIFKYNNDFFSLVVYRKLDVILLANKLLPLSRHPEKIAIMKLLIENCENNSWDKIENKFRELRNHIKESRLK